VTGDVLDFPDASHWAAWLAAAARAGFERLGRSDRYAVILPLLKARDPRAHARLVANAVARLAGQP
jgi:hypothetical protein